MIRIRRHVLERVHEEARAAYARDQESCGFLAGPSGDGRVDEVVPMENRADRLHALDPEAYPRTGRTYFDIDPMKFARQVEERAAAGRPVKVLYHSHLDVGAYFSETDAAAATGGGARPTYDGLAYLVTSVRGGRVDDDKLFVWDEATRAFLEADLEADETT